jgi:glucose 1-dehydrogenase
MSTAQFAGTVALVTGAAKGMGEATALAFAAAGAHVVAADIDAAGVTETAGRAEHGQIVAVRADVSDAADVARMVATCVDRFGGLDVAVNNAAIEIGSARLADFDDADYERLIAVNVTGMYLCLKHELRQLVSQRRGGAIINIASVNSFRAKDRQSVYTATKYAVVGLTKSAAIEYAEYGIRVNAIAPGAIDTPMLRETLERFHRDPSDAARRMSGFGRFGRPEEIAEAALWLASPLSSYTTGHVLAVDGGHLAG